MRNRDIKYLWLKEANINKQYKWKKIKKLTEINVKNSSIFYYIAPN